MLEVYFYPSIQYNTHFLSRRSIRGLRTVSASMAALLPLAEPFIWTSSWFICFTQSSITGLKLGERKQQSFSRPYIFRLQNTGTLEEVLVDYCWSYWITKKVSRAGWGSFVQVEMFSNLLPSLSSALSEGSSQLYSEKLSASNQPALLHSVFYEIR